MSYTLTIAIVLTQSQTGLTLRAQLQDTTKTNVGSPITTGFIEEGLGAYGWTGPIPAAFRGYVRFELLDGTFKAMAAIDGTEEQIFNAVGSGSGPFAMLIHVTRASDGANVPGADVSAAGNQTAGPVVTDENGIATLNLSAGSVNLLVTAPGYANSAVTPQTVVSGGTWESTGTNSLTVAMVANAVVTPPGPGQINGVVVVYDAQGNVRSGVSLKFRLQAVIGTTGVYDTTDKLTVASDVNGQIVVPLILGATYQFWATTGKTEPVPVPTSGSSFNLPAILGKCAA